MTLEVRMADQEKWIELATFNRGFEADIAISRLESAGLPAIKRRNDSVGVFGAGFEGATAGGVTVLVPESSADEARELLKAQGETE
jgi:hypothetical protein